MQKNVILLENIILSKIVNILNKNQYLNEVINYRVKELEVKIYKLKLSYKWGNCDDKSFWKSDYVIYSISSVKKKNLFSASDVADDDVSKISYRKKLGPSLEHYTQGL